MLAKLLCHFDVEICPESGKWINLDVYPMYWQFMVKNMAWSSAYASIK